MPEVGLDGAGVVAVVGELEPAGVPQHVGMNEKGEFRSHARPGQRGPRRKGLKRAASETRRQKFSSAVRAPAAPPLA